MSAVSVVKNQEDVFVRVKMINDSTGAPETGIVAATAGHVIWYQRENEAVVTDGGSAADASGLTASHTDWQFDEIGYGYYQIAFPDAAFAEGAGSVLCGMDTTDASCVAAEVYIDHFFKFYGTPASVTSTTITFPAGPNVEKGDQIVVMDGIGQEQTRLVESVAGQVATVEAWTTQPTTSSLILLVPGDPVSADGGINVDATVSSRSSHSESDVATEVQTIVDNGVTVTKVGSTTLNQSGVGGQQYGA